MAYHPGAVDADHIEHKAADLGHAGGDEATRGRRGSGKRGKLSRHRLAVDGQGGGVVFPLQGGELVFAQTFVTHQ